MLFVPVPFGSEGFQSVYDQVSAADGAERLLFGYYENRAGKQAPAVARIALTEETREPSITTVELSTTNSAAPVWRAKLFMGDLVVDRSVLIVRLEGDLTHEDAREVFDMDLRLGAFVGTAGARVSAFENVANIALQLNQQQV
ncbi:MAG TPA: hypothetical protein VL737_00535 [Candidatus Pristimantibacillus sp.]|jgi:hypothetical protein|nr:hypothetical protein [Candidatus Pristimantibacillus sp.]